MALELECRIVRKLAVQAGRSTRGDWEKQEFIVEYKDGNYANQVCMNVWGSEKVKDLENFQVGDEVKVSFNLSSREFNGRWYSDIRVWKMERMGAPQKAPVQQAPMPTEEDLPAGDSFDDNDLPF